MNLQQQTTQKLDDLYKAIQTLPSGPEKTKLMQAANALDEQIEVIRDAAADAHFNLEEYDAV